MNKSELGQEFTWLDTIELCEDEIHEQLQILIDETLDNLRRSSAKKDNTSFQAHRKKLLRLLEIFQSPADEAELVSALKALTKDRG